MDAGKKRQTARLNPSGPDATVRTLLPGDEVETKHSSSRVAADRRLTLRRDNSFATLGVTTQLHPAPPHPGAMPLDRHQVMQDALNLLRDSGMESLTFLSEEEAAQLLAPSSHSATPPHEQGHLAAVADRVDSVRGLDASFRSFTEQAGRDQSRYERQSAFASAMGGMCCCVAAIRRRCDAQVITAAAGLARIDHELQLAQPDYRATRHETLQGLANDVREYAWARATPQAADAGETKANPLMRDDTGRPLFVQQPVPQVDHDLLGDAFLERSALLGFDPRDLDEDMAQGQAAPLDPRRRTSDGRSALARSGMHFYLNDRMRGDLEALEAYDRSLAHPSHGAAAVPLQSAIYLRQKLELIARAQLEIEDHAARRGLAIQATNALNPEGLVQVAAQFDEEHAAMVQANQQEQLDTVLQWQRLKKLEQAPPYE